MMLEMQDVQYSIGGGGGAGAGGGDRRMRPQHFQINHQSLQALKCPRCDSVNTKFCYFNNYNLSQPRHFCKGCRRYWTRGGVLRNVPVGGGCRKAKRSNPKPQSETSAAVRTVRERKAANSHSSSESSSLTATTPAVATAAAATKAVTASLSRSAPVLITGENPSFEVVGLMEQQPPSCGIFPESGSFTNLLSSINDASPFEFNNNSSSNISDLTTSFGYQFQGQDNNRWQPQKMAGVGVVEELRKQEITAVGMLDQAVHIDLSTFHNSRSSNVGFGSLDWHVNGDQVLCDLPNTADQAYWVQSQWTTTDHQDHHPNLFLP